MMSYHQQYEQRDSKPETETQIRLRNFDDAMTLLASIPTPETVTIIMELAYSSNPRVRAYGIKALERHSMATLGPKTYIDTLAHACRDLLRNQ